MLLPLLHTLYCDHHGWLLNWLKRRVHCVQDASDLAQDTFSELLVAAM
ncbi:sigma factor [Comamonas thiooxydans]|nr:sigma factor [Comamonas thiooxydans]